MISLEAGQYGSKNYDSISASVVTFTLKGQDDVDYNVRDFAVAELAPPLHLQPLKFSPYA